MTHLWSARLRCQVPRVAAPRIVRVKEISSGTVKGCCSVLKASKRYLLLQANGMPALWLLSAAVLLRTLTGLAMADYGGPLTVGTAQDLVKHAAPRSRWECSASETRLENRPSTPLRHLPEAPSSRRKSRSLKGALQDGKRELDTLA
jgi:hypothetical protein